jgi:hypothetical protein
MRLLRKLLRKQLPMRALLLRLPLKLRAMPLLLLAMPPLPLVTLLLRQPMLRLLQKHLLKHRSSNHC